MTFYMMSNPASGKELYQFTIPLTFERRMQLQRDHATR